jgi:TrmH family RNA methyltransferase
MTNLVLTSMQNARVKDVVKLRQRRDRDKSKTFIIEGYREITRALEGGMPFQTLFTCPELFLGENEEALIDAIVKKGAQHFECAPHVFQKMSYRDRPDGLITVAPQLLATLQDLPKKKNPFYIVAEAIEKPGNLGTILRSADAAGVDGVIICDKCTDIHNPNVVRASVGTLFTQPVVEATTEETLAWLKENGIAVLSATPEAKESYSKVDMKQSLAIVVGTEQYGLSDKWMQEADICVRIPMRGKADSLNVATATTILLYEVVRQRSYE